MVTSQRPGGSLRTPFVGREAEYSELRCFLDSAADGWGALVMLAGEPGIGKTRLAEELAAEARGRGMLPLAGRCHEMEGAPPYMPFVEMLESVARQVEPKTLRGALGDAAPQVAKLMPELRQQFSDIPAPLQVPAEYERRHLFSGLCEFLQQFAQQRPLLLTLEDLHWADTGTLFLLEHVARWLREMPVLAIATYRDSDLAPEHPLARTLDELLRNRLARFLALEGLDQSEVGLMLEALSSRPAPPSLVTLVLGETEGNPFFIEEVYKSLAEEGKLFDDSGNWRHDLSRIDLHLPEGIRLVTSRRLGRVSERTQCVLVTAALVGRAFDFKLLAAISRVDGEALLDAIEEAERARLITCVAADPEPRFTFSHELIRQTLLSGVSAPRRQQLHLQLAEAMEGTRAHVLEEHAADIAQQLRQAGAAADPDKTVHYLRVAAKQAIAAAAYEEAARHCQTALAVLDRKPEADNRQRCDLLLLLGEAAAKSGAPSQARHAFQQAAEVARGLRDSQRLAAAALGMDEHTGQAGIIDSQVADLLEEAAGALRDSDSAMRAMVIARRALALSWSDSYSRMLSLSEQAVEMAQRIGDTSALACALEARHRVLATPEGLSQRLAVASDIVRLAEEVKNKALALQGRLLYINDLLALGDMAKVDPEIETFERLAGEVKIPLHQWDSLNLRVSQALIGGRFDEAERLASESLAFAQRVEIPNAEQLYMAHMFGVRREQGRLEDIETAVRDLAERYPEIPGWRCALAYVYSDLGRTGLARAEFERLAQDGFAHIPCDIVWVSSLAFLAHVCAFLRDGARAATLYQLLLPSAGQNVVIVGTALYSGPVSHYLGLLATTMGHWEEASQHFQDALEMASCMGARPFIGRTQLEYARTLLARGRREDLSHSRELLQAACDTFTELAMHDYAARARELLARPRLATARALGPAYPDRLTQREVEVLGLIAAGRTNKEIAESLTLSVRTVGRHITNIYAKIGARSKADATAYALRQGLVEMRPDL